MSLVQSIQTCFRKYATFRGTASRSEYWWWYLFLAIATLVATVIKEWLSIPIALVTFIPTIAVTVRRLHDTDRSAWWLLITMVPLIGAILLFIWTVQATVLPNRYTMNDRPF